MTTAAQPKDRAMPTPPPDDDPTQGDPGPTEAPASPKERAARAMRRAMPYVIVAQLLLILAVVFLWHRIVVVIPTGQAGVLFRLFTGTEVDEVFGEGVHLTSPLNKMTLYELRKQVIQHEFDVITAKGLSIHLSLAVRYHPEPDMLGALHQRIGPDYDKRVIVPQIESVMRKQLGRYVAEDIYTNKDGLMNRAISLAVEEVGRNFVQVEDIIIRSIQLPDKIKAAIEEKLTEEERLKSYEFRLQSARQEAARLHIEALGRKEHNLVLSESLTDRVLQHERIEAARDLAKSSNAKTVILGGGAHDKLMLSLPP